MLIKRIFWTLLITGVIVTSATITQAQSASRKSWSRGNSVNYPISPAPDQATDQKSVTEPQTASLDGKKMAIVGSWLTPLGIGIRVVNSFTSDGIALGSGQADVSLMPELPTLTPQHGVWKYLGGRQFAVARVAVQYDVPTGEYRGLIRIQVSLTVSDTGDEFSGTSTVKIYDADGNLVDTLSFPIQGERIKVETSN
jgi:hypothetical protein